MISDAVQFVLCCGLLVLGWMLRHRGVFAPRTNAAEEDVKATPRPARRRGRRKQR